MEQQVSLVWPPRNATLQAWRKTVLVVLRIVVLAAIIGSAVVCLASTVDPRLEALISAKTP